MKISRTTDISIKNGPIDLSYSVNAEGKDVFYISLVADAKVIEFNLNATQYKLLHDTMDALRDQVKTANTACGLYATGTK